MKRPLHILMADDDADDVDLFRQTLHIIDPAIGFNSASNGVEVLELLEQQGAPDILFLDLNMPMADGKQCLQAIKENDKLQHMPVVMFTTSSFPTDVGECLALGASCFITKPTDIMEWRSILHTIISNARGDIAGALKQLHTTVEIYY